MNSVIIGNLSLPKRKSKTKILILSVCYSGKWQAT